MSAVEDVAAIDVHVLDHPLVHRRVGGELDRRRRLVAEAGAAAGREDHDIGTRRHLAGDRGRVVAGAVHEDEARVSTGSAYLKTPVRLVVPPLAAAPSDFSRMVVSPPALLPGEGLLFISPPLRAV
jgi:hypothetical protein